MGTAPAGPEKPLSRARLVAFSLIPLLVLLSAAELLLRAIYFQRSSPHATALEQGGEALRQEVLMAKAKAHVRKFRLPQGALYTPEGRALLAEFQRRYETHFASLAAEVSKSGSRLVVLYIPSDDYVKLAGRRDFCRRYYAGLAAKYGLDFLDLTDEFLKHPAKAVTLLPENGHLSRFGNQLVAARLRAYLSKFPGFEARPRHVVRPKVLGDLPPGRHEVWSNEPTMPYMVPSNSQGFRMTRDLSFPKTRRRILALGDSYTFGPHLPTHHGYPYLLERSLPDSEVINAGIAGYTIVDEASLFSERAKYAEPDITILQVLDNDLEDFFFYKRNEFNRERKVYAPSDLERAFLSRFHIAV